MSSDLAAEYETACWQAIAAGRTLTPPYEPTAWISMVHRHGAVEAAKRLLVSGDVQSGFERLVQGGRDELTVERSVLDRRWSSLFDERHREAARWRLRQAGLDV